MKAHFNGEEFKVKIDKVLLADALDFASQFSLGATVAIGHKNGLYSLCDMKRMVWLKSGKPERKI